MPDPYAEVRSLCASLEAAGVDVETICDALMTTGLNAGARLASPECVSAYCLRMAEVFAAKADNRTMPPVLTQ